MNMNKSLMDAADLGIINGHITLNGLKDDTSAVKGLWAPPFFSDNFRMEIRFNGCRIAADKCFWQPQEIFRKGTRGSLQVQSDLVLTADSRGAVMVSKVVNLQQSPQTVEIQYELTGGPAAKAHWTFLRPGQARSVPPVLKKGKVVFDGEDDLRIAVGSTLSLRSDTKEIFNAAPLTLESGKELTFYTVIVFDKKKEADALLKKLLSDPAGAIASGRKNFNQRVRQLDKVMPSFSSSNEGLNRLYDRSLLHFLLNEFRVKEWKINPYYAAGGINGGCCCCYLWNYGEPYRLWSLLDPQAAKVHLKTYLGIDLATCYAFFPDDGLKEGPYYPVNQEKVLLLAYALCLNTKDTTFLHENVNGKKVIDLLIEAAVLHDDLSKEAHLVDYGDGNHHLELRGSLRYDGIVPDLNLRRCVNYHLCATLCRMAKVKPPFDFEKRAEDLKKQIEIKLFDEKHRWFKAVDPAGKDVLRYTIQLFKTLGWGSWALSEKCRKALMSHLNEEEFIGKYGMHSLAKHDPAYDPRDIDNGGPGACISFTPAVVDRLYCDGEKTLAWNIFKRLLWLGEKLPYWGDSHTADRMEYRRDTPLQNDIQGAALAQTIIFGIFGITVNENFSIVISPSLPENDGWMRLENIRLTGKVFSVEVDKNGFSVACDGKIYHAENGQKIILEK